MSITRLSCDCIILDNAPVRVLLFVVLLSVIYVPQVLQYLQAGNILVDSNGAVKLADFGVSACMFDTGDRQRSRNTFVGTPCWYVVLSDLTC